MPAFWRNQTFGCFDLRTRFSGSERTSFSDDTMSVASARVSLVVSTVNRTVELSRLMESLLEQDFKEFEIVVVDQNSDDRIVPLLERYQTHLKINRVSTPSRHGISVCAK